MLRRAVKNQLPLALVALLGAGIAVSGVSATQTQHRAARTVYKLSATLKGPHGSGTFSGSLTTKGATGVLTWKLKLRPATKAKTEQLRAGRTGTGMTLATLCAPCAPSAHGTAHLSGHALTGAAKGHIGVAAQTLTGTVLRGALKRSPSTSTPPGGGGLTITPTPALVAQGKSLSSQNSCTGCHTTTGGQSTGPTWKGLYGSTVHLEGGGTTQATASYLVGVITNPSSLDVAGYDPSIMSEAVPAGSISQSQAKAIVAYIMTLK